MDLLATSRKKFGSCLGSLKSLAQKAALSSYEAVLLITSEHQNSTKKIHHTNEEPPPFSEEFINWREAVNKRKPMCSSVPIKRTIAGSSINRVPMPMPMPMPQNFPKEFEDPGFSAEQQRVFDRDEMEFLPLFRMANCSKRDRFPATTHANTRKKSILRNNSPTRRLSPNVIATGNARATPGPSNDELWENLIDNTQKQVAATKTLPRILTH